MRAFITWAVLTLLGTGTMLAIQVSFGGKDAGIIVPISQAVGLWVAWIAAWPLWFKQQPKRRFGFGGHVASMLFIMFVVLAIRIEFRLG